MKWEGKEEEGRGQPKYVYEFRGESEWCVVVVVVGGCSSRSSSDRRPPVPGVVWDDLLRRARHRQVLAPRRPQAQER